jgi:hypothetical protein
LQNLWPPTPVSCAGRLKCTRYTCRKQIVSLLVPLDVKPGLKCSECRVIFVWVFTCPDSMPVDPLCSNLPATLLSERFS